MLTSVESNDQFAGNLVEKFLSMRISEIRSLSSRLEVQFELAEDAEDAFLDAEDEFFDHDGLAAWNDMEGALSRLLEESGVRRLDDGVHFSTVLRLALWSAAARSLLTIPGNPKREQLSAQLTDLVRKIHSSSATRTVPPSFLAQEVIGAASDSRRDESLVRPRLDISFVVTSDGQEVSSANRSVWLDARLTGVTATDARKLVLLTGAPSRQRPSLLNQKLSGDEGPLLQSFAHGREREVAIAAWVEGQFGIRPNDKLCHGVNPRHLATPDGIGDSDICEIKTSTKGLNATSATYRDQIQWQMHVTGADRVLFVVEHRYTAQLDWMWVDRDAARISTLVHHADSFLVDLDRGRQGASRGPDVASGVSRVRFVDSLCAGPIVGPDHVETEAWPADSSRALLAQYGAGRALSELAHHFGTTSRSVVFELTRKLLVHSEPLVNAGAQRYGMAWSADEIAYVNKLHHPKQSIEVIARTFGRDQLAIAFILFAHRTPTIPPGE